MKIEISFDDGCVSDLKAANLLLKYGFTGTFYVTNSPVAGTVQMSLKEMKGLVDKGMMLGGHTVSHPLDMKILDDEQLDFEIRNNKFLLEINLLKRLATKFCYPRGRHDERVREAVKKAGYTEARTTLVLHITNHKSDPFQTPTTIHMFSRKEYNGTDWLELGKKYFRTAVEHSKTNPDTFFSLWGHSYELDRNGEWGKFEEMLQFMKENCG